VFRNSIFKGWAMISTILQVAGFVAVTVGAGLIFLPAGLIVGGAFLILIGLAVVK
jgi:hypothetical protein